MKYSTLSAVAALLAGPVAASSCTYADGYTYCDETEKFVYNNVGFSGTYSDVVSMDNSKTDVSRETFAFSGSLSPFDEELSVHIRGPINMEEFAVYYPSDSSSSKKRDAAEKRDEDEEDCATTQHLHHKHVKRATKVVTQTMYVNQGGEPITKTVSLGDGSETTSSTETSTAKTGLTSSSLSTLTSSSSVSAGDWVRKSHWVPGSTTNLTVLNNFGGSGSGVWSSALGNSLSYANSDNSDGASEATALEDVTLASLSEFSFWSGLECGDDSEEYDCGYYRPGTVAYHAFAGAEKIMVFSFTMPEDSSTESSLLTGYDMPAIWLLNAKIPRIGQYLGVSCWSTGCGELDLFEVLVNDYTKMVTALHDNQDGERGSSDYISRPYSSTMKAVVIFYEGEIHIQVIDSDYEFSDTLSSEQVALWTSVEGTEITLS